MAPVIAVVGATGAQGGAVVDALLGLGGFRVRAFTRRPESDTAQKLAQRGCEVVKADLDSPDTLPAAFQGCEGAYLVTNFWEHLNAEREIKQACTAADAAAAAGVKHIVWSSLEDTRPLFANDPSVPDAGPNGMKVPHLDAKHDATVYMESKGYPVTSLNTSCYMENFTSFFKPYKQPDGSYLVVLPDLGPGVTVPFVAVRDIGKAAAALLKKGPDAAGKRASIVGEYMTLGGCVKTLAEVTGQQIKYAALSYDAFYEALLAAGQPKEAARDMTNMWKLYGLKAADVAAARPLSASQELVPDALSFRQWAEANKDALLAAMG